MKKSEILERIDKLRDELIRLQGEERSNIKTIANINARLNSIKRRRKEIHDEITKIKVEILKMGLI